MSTTTTFNYDDSNDRVYSETALNIVKSAGSLFKNRLNRTQQIDNINKAYKAKKLVLVLGAGVSIDHGLPDWNTLLQKLLFNALKDNELETNNEPLSVLAELFTKVFSPNPLIAARYLKNQFERKRSASLKAYPRSKRKKQFVFEEEVRKALYDRFDKGHSSYFFEEMQLICHPSNSGSIDSVITYNYDDILEQYLAESETATTSFKLIATAGVNPKVGDIPIYHVNGFLPHSNKYNIEKIILSEDTYHELYKDNYNWSNFLQVNKFKDFTCLFIGISLGDPNLRRLLDIAKQLRGNQRIQHYIIQQRNDPENTKKKMECCLNTYRDLMKRKLLSHLDFDKTNEALAKLMDEIKENDALSFGLSTIWINDFEEIPHLLNCIKNN